MCCCASGVRLVSLELLEEAVVVRMLFRDRVEGDSLLNGGSCVTRAAAAAAAAAAFFIVLGPGPAMAS